MRGWTPNQGGSPPPQGTYPGIGDPFAGPPALYNPVQVLPPTTIQSTPTPAAPAKGGGLSSMINFNEIKGMVERMGGIDGILANVGKLQKIMATMQQMAPVLRLLIGKGTAGTAAADESDGVRPRKRRRTGKSRTRTGGHSRRRTGTRRRR
ncbi:tyrosine protein kinase [Cohnella lubricantis]